jgi:hypothetical protein
MKSKIHLDWWMHVGKNSMQTEGGKAVLSSNRSGSDRKMVKHQNKTRFVQCSP